MNIIFCGQACGIKYTEGKKLDFFLTKTNIHKYIQHHLSVTNATKVVKSQNYYKILQEQRQRQQQQQPKIITSQT